MTNIPAYDRQDAVPWNTESGKNIAPTRAGVELAWGNDLRFDPADEGYDPKTGWERGLDVGSPG